MLILTPGNCHIHARKTFEILCHQILPDDMGHLPLPNSHLRIIVSEYIISASVHLCKNAIRDWITHDPPRYIECVAAFYQHSDR